MIIQEALVCISKVWRPLVDEGDCMHPESWPNLGATTVNSDVYTRTSVLLEGEQNIILLFEGSEQHTTPCTSYVSLPFLD
jgi:hypothetical protein